MKTNQDNYELMYKLTTALKMSSELLELISIGSPEFASPYAISYCKTAIEEAEKELALIEQ